MDSPDLGLHRTVPGILSIPRPMGSPDLGLHRTVPVIPGSLVFKDPQATLTWDYTGCPWDPGILSIPGSTGSPDLGLHRMSLVNPWILGSMGSPNLGLHRTIPGIPGSLVFQDPSAPLTWDYTGCPWDPGILIVFQDP